MKLEGEQILLRVYLRNTDKYGWWRNAADMLVARARREGLAGSTLLRGIFGLDCTGKVLDSGLFSVTEHVPVIVEFVDAPRTTGRFLETVTQVVSEGMATLERGHVLRYRTDRLEVSQSSGLTVPGQVVDLSTLPSPAEFPVMKFGKTGQLIRIFIGESDIYQGEPLYRVIVLRARELGLCGATVL